MKLKKYTSHILLSLMILFSACGGGGGGSTAIVLAPSESNESSDDTTDDTSSTTAEETRVVEEESAYLIDAALSGVHYITESTSDITDGNGTIRFLSSDKNIHFQVGNVVLGDFNLSNLNRDRKIFINELLGVDRSDSNNEQVTKLLQFLQSLDSNDNPLDGIDINASTSLALESSNLDFREDNITVDDINQTLMKFSRKMLSKEEAVTYFEKSLESAGIYNDSYAPIFLSPKEFHVKENQLSSVNTSVLDATEVTFSLDGVDAAYFTIDKQSGLISFINKPDYEMKNHYTIIVEATDETGKISTQSIEIFIDDVYEKYISIPTLIVVMNWNDYRESDASIWYERFFAKDSKSVNSWLDETMLGGLSLSPVNETSGTYHDGVIMVDMLHNHPGGGYEIQFRDIYIKSAITNSEVTQHLDFRELDSNHDGILSQEELQIIFIVAGGEEAYGDPVDHSIWAHSWSFSSNSGPIVDGVSVMQYSDIKARSGSYACFGARHGNHQATRGLIIHELGHSLLDLGDYYDNGGGSGLGWYDIMSGGGWASKLGDLYAGETPTQYSAYNKIDLDLGLESNVINVSSTQTLTLSCSDKDIVKLVTQKDNEYFLLECRDTQKYQSDMAINAADRRFTENRLFTIIYHVDTDKSGNTEDGPQTSLNHYKVAVVEKETAELMTDTEHIRADFSDIYLPGDTIGLKELYLYDGSSTNYSIDILSADYTQRTMTIKITKD